MSHRDLSAALPRWAAPLAEHVAHGRDAAIVIPAGRKNLRRSLVRWLEKAGVPCEWRDADMCVRGLGHVALLHAARGLPPGGVAIVDGLERAEPWQRDMLRELAETRASRGGALGRGWILCAIEAGDAGARTERVVPLSEVLG